MNINGWRVTQPGYWHCQSGMVQALIRTTSASKAEQACGYEENIIWNSGTTVNER
jgi:hypothetical protein